MSLPGNDSMKFSISNVLLAVLLVALGLGWFIEHRRAGELQTEIDRLNSHLGPDYFVYRYHPIPDLSGFSKDPLAGVDSETRDLYKALVMQPEAWSSGLNQYLGIDRIRTEVEPKVTMTVWWRGSVKDAEGKNFFVHLADRARGPNTKSADRLHHYFSAYIVTDDTNKLLHWNACEIDRMLVTEVELSRDTFPAELKYRQQSRFNGDSGIEYRNLTKSGISK